MRYGDNPAAPQNLAGGSNAPPNYMNYGGGGNTPWQPAWGTNPQIRQIPSGTGAGSNQYQSLPPWMNTSLPQRAMPASGGYMPPGGIDFQPIGPATYNPQPLPTQQSLQQTEQQLINKIPGGSMVSNPTTNQLLHDILGTNIPVTNPQGQPWAMGTPQQQLMQWLNQGVQPLGMNNSMNYQMPSRQPTSGIAPGSFPPGMMSPVYAPQSYGLGVPPQSAGYIPGQTSGWTGAGGGPIQGGGPFSIEQPVDPQLSQQLWNYLYSQIGKGATPFNLPTQLPFGGTTQPGQLNAMANPLLQNLMSFYQGGQSSSPGANTLATIANQGISALPEWQSMVQAQGQNIAQNEAQLREQFAQMGGVTGSPFGNALSNYMQGTTAQQNALLGQLQQQNILQGQIPVAEGLFSGAQQFGQYGQALDQQAIQNMWNEMIRTSPQYSPLLQYMYGGATSYDPVLNRAGTTGGGALAGLNFSPSFQFPQGG